MVTRAVRASFAYGISTWQSSKTWGSASTSPLRPDPVGPYRFVMATRSTAGSPRRVEPLDVERARRGRADADDVVARREPHDPVVPPGAGERVEAAAQVEPGLVLDRPVREVELDVAVDAREDVQRDARARDGRVEVQ